MVYAITAPAHVVYVSTTEQETHSQKGETFSS